MLKTILDYEIFLFYAVERLSQNAKNKNNEYETGSYLFFIWNSLEM